MQSLRLIQNSERLHVNLIIWPNAPEEIFGGDSVQTHAMCWMSLSLSLWRRTIELAKSTSSGLVPSLLFPDDSAFLRDGIEDEVPSTTRIPSTFHSSILFQSVSRWSRRSRRWKDSEIPPQTIENEGEFPGQGKSLSSYEQRVKDYRFNGSHWIRIFRFSLNFEGKELPA